MGADAALIALFRAHWRECTDNQVPPWNLGPYNNAEQNSTVDCLGLLQCQALLRRVFTQVPCGIINHKYLRRVLQSIATEVKGSDKTDELWSDWLAGKVRTAMSHIRRLRNVNQVYQQRTKALTPGQRATLDELIALYQPSEGDIARSEAEAAGQQCSESTACGETPSPQAPDSKQKPSSSQAACPNTAGTAPGTVQAAGGQRRRLRRRTSAESDLPTFDNIAVAASDSDSGSSLPCNSFDAREGRAMIRALVAGTKSPTMQSKAMKDALSAIPRPAGFKAQSGEVKAALETRGQPAAAASAVASLRKRPAGIAEAPPSKKAKGPGPAGCPPITAMRVVSAKNPARSYIRGLLDDSGKLRLVTEVTEKHCSGLDRTHRQVIDHIVQCIERDRLDKAGAVALRDTLIGRG